MKKNLYQTVTDRILAELEQGAAPWLKPWKHGRGNGAGLLPRNAATGHRYRGINVPILWGAAEAAGYPAHGWMTFKQALDLGGHVRKGEKGTQVVFTKKLTVKEEAEGGEERERQVSMLRGYTVFNLAQIDGLPERITAPVAPPPPELRESRVASFVEATRADIRHGGNEACFIPSRDIVQMPPAPAFRSPEHYEATLLHELGHWSGHNSRLDRNLTGRFGTQAYAAEELIAELTAAFLCAHLGVTGELRHAGYIASWVRLLKDDKRAIFTAASKASQAADYLRAFSEPEPEEDDADEERAA